jgi:hypothetical protein
MTQPLPPCKCGLMPHMAECTIDGNQIIQIRCACGNHGGSVFYQKPEDAARTRQAAIDGWALAQG